MVINQYKLLSHSLIRIFEPRSKFLRSSWCSGASGVLSFENKNKSVFILYSSHLFVILTFVLGTHARK